MRRASESTLAMPLKNTTKTVCFFITALLLCGIIAGAYDQKPDPSQGATFKVLVYSNTGYYRHPEIPKINRWLVLLGHENGFEVDVTEHWKDMRPEELGQY